MSGIVGFVNYKKDMSECKNILEDMNNQITRRESDEQGFFMQKHVALGHKRLIVVDPDGDKQPMIEKYSQNEYVIVFNGQIYNTKELKQN